jgi:acetyl-CoA acetyltransferase
MFHAHDSGGAATGTAEFPRARDTALGGRLPVNPNDGLGSQGHQIGATGNCLLCHHRSGASD